MVTKRVAESIARVYYDPEHPAGLGSLEKLRTGLPNVPKTDIQRWSMSQYAYTKHRNRKKTFPRNRIYVTSMDEIFQADLIDLSLLAAYNKRYKYILTVIDLLSRYAWAKPLKTKTPKDVIPALDEIFRERVPSKLNTDAGTEFVNKHVKAYLKGKNVQTYLSYGNIKCGMIERWNRTLKSRIYRLISKTDNWNYIKHLQRIVDGYNKAKHSSIGMAPKDVNINNEHLVWKRLYLKKRPKRKEPKLKAGDVVRISADKGIFAKGYTGYWTTEAFVVQKVLRRDPPVYVIGDQHGETIKGTFYEQEVQKIEL